MKGGNSRKSTSSTTTTSETKKETEISYSHGRGLDPHLLRTEKGNKPLVERLGLALAWDGRWRDQRFAPQETEFSCAWQAWVWAVENVS